MYKKALKTNDILEGFVYGTDQAVYFFEEINFPTISYWLASKP